MRLFWERGYSHTSMPMLAEAMGVSSQSLYAAFDSKDVLYREALELYRTMIGGFAARALDEGADAIEAVARVVRDAAEIFARTAGSPSCMITAVPDADEDEPPTMFGRRLRAESIARVAERIERGRAEGQVRPDADSAAWARLIGSIVQGMSIQARDGATVDALRSIAALFADSLHALRP
jgi:AcrR family transcriptional regulator